MRNAQTESLHITNMAFIPQTLHGTAIYADQARGGARGVNGAAVRPGSPISRVWVLHSSKPTQRCPASTPHHWSDSAGARAAQNIRTRLEDLATEKTTRRAPLDHPKHSKKQQETDPHMILNIPQYDLPLFVRSR